MIVYLTFNDAPSGIYSSQVIDVVKYIRQEIGKDIQLVALISGRNYFAQKRKIKNEEPGATVLPMFPGVKNWKRNLWMLRMFSTVKKADMIIGRSVLAAKLGMQLKKKTIYDGRGAIAAEWKEYKVIADESMLKEISSWEKECIQKSAFRIAVSEELIKYWKKEYDYSSGKHVVIPCTLNLVFESLELNPSSIRKERTKYGFKDEDVVFVYSGSVAGWQSFHILGDFLRKQLSASENCKALFLSESSADIRALEKEFPGRIICKKLSPSEVPFSLMAADYGLLIREKSITNQVASPVKFAEYLACGLKVIISEDLGDASEFVKKYNCGSLYTDFSFPERVSLSEKSSMRNIGLEHYSKRSHREAYKKMLRTC